MGKPNQTAAKRNDLTFGSDAGGGGLLATSPFERHYIAGSPRLREELGFQTLALLMVPLALGFAVYRVAVSLLGYAPGSAAGLASMAGIALFALDRHYLIQARGSQSADVRLAMLKVRAFSILVISLAFVLMVTDTFRSDIEGVLAEARRERRAELERSPRYQAEIETARDSLSQAQEQAERANALRARISTLEGERSKALQDMTDEIQGNITGATVRQEGFGPKARGHQSTANRLQRDIEIAGDELRDLGDVSARIKAASARLAEIDARIDAETELAYGGKTQRLEALVPLLQNSLSAWVSIGFWVIFGMLPDLLMLAAQRRMFNHDEFAAMRAAEQEHIRADIAHGRRELRRIHTDRLPPVDARLAAVAVDPARAAQDTGAALGTTGESPQGFGGGRA